MESSYFKRDFVKGIPSLIGQLRKSSITEPIRNGRPVDLITKDIVFQINFCADLSYLAKAKFTICYCVIFKKMVTRYAERRPGKFLEQWAAGGGGR